MGRCDAECLLDESLHPHGIDSHLQYDIFFCGLVADGDDTEVLVVDEVVFFVALFCLVVVAQGDGGVDGQLAQEGSHVETKGVLPVLCQFFLLFGDFHVDVGFGGDAERFAFPQTAYVLKTDGEGLGGGEHLFSCGSNEEGGTFFSLGYGDGGLAELEGFEDGFVLRTHQGGECDGLGGCVGQCDGQFHSFGVVVVECLVFFGEGPEVLDAAVVVAVAAARCKGESDDAHEGKKSLFHVFLSFSCC